MLKAMHALLHHDLEIPKERQLKEYFFQTYGYFGALVISYFFSPLLLDSCFSSYLCSKL
jgi:hypothetical protein